VLVHGIKTLQQRDSECRPSLSRERERVLQNLCGFAFHGPILAAGTLRTSHVAPDGEPVVRGIARYLTQQRGGGGGGGGARAASSPLPAGLPDHASNRSGPILERGPCA